MNGVGHAIDTAATARPRPDTYGRGAIPSRPQQLGWLLATAGMPPGLRARALVGRCP